MRPRLAGAGVPSGMQRRTSLTAERDVTITVVLSCIFVIVRHPYGGGPRSMWLEIRKVPL